MSEHPIDIQKEGDDGNVQEQEEGEPVDLAYFGFSVGPVALAGDRVVEELHYQEVSDLDDSAYNKPQEEGRGEHL